MCLIHCDQIYIHIPDTGKEKFRGEAFRGKVEEFIVPKDTIVQRHINFIPGHARMDGSSLDSSLVKLVHLILHQSNQRGDYQANSLHGQRRNLEGY